MKNLKLLALLLMFSNPTLYGMPGDDVGVNSDELPSIEAPDSGCSRCPMCGACVRNYPRVDAIKQDLVGVGMARRDFKRRIQGLCASSPLAKSPATVVTSSPAPEEDFVAEDVDFEEEKN